MVALKFARKMVEVVLVGMLLATVAWLGSSRSVAEHCETIVNAVHCPGATGTLACSSYTPSAAGAVNRCNYTYRIIGTGPFACTDQSTAFSNCVAIKGGTAACTQTYNCEIDMAGLNCQTDNNTILTLTTTAGTYGDVPCVKPPPPPPPPPVE